jgi:3-carboxy-cis,cis-muconate cycloisomerase
MMLLSERLGRDVAHKLLEEATRKSAAQGLRLADVLAEMPEVKDHIEPAALQQLEAPEHYLGAAEEFRTGLLGKRNTSE